MTNRVSAEMTQQQVETVLGAIDTIKENLPFLINLKPEDRAGLPKMEDNRRPFVEKALDYAKKDKDMLPRYIDIEELEKDLTLFRNLASIDRELGRMDEMVKDTLAAVGSESYVAALSVYNASKLAARNGHWGTDSVVEDLKKLFYNQGNKGTEE